MNFLELAQKVASKSGTISGIAPTTVVGQTGRLGKIVAIVNDAWQQIQNHRNAWKWMRAEFSGKETIADTARYTASAWALTRFRAWIIDDAKGYQPVSLYLQSAGVATEAPIRFIPWEQWRAQYGRGSHDANQPGEYTVSPANELCLGPTPNAVYIVAGEYRKSNQTLSANDDIPEMPADFHDLIWQYALEILAGDDEAPTAFANARTARGPMVYALERDQLPEVVIGCGPLA